MVKSKTFQGRAPEDVLNELASIKDLLLDIDANIEALLIASERLTTYRDRHEADENQP